MLPSLPYTPPVPQANLNQSRSASAQMEASTLPPAPRWVSSRVTAPWSAYPRADIAGRMMLVRGFVFGLSRTVVEPPPIRCQFPPGAHSISPRLSLSKCRLF